MAASEFSLEQFNEACNHLATGAGQVGALVSVFNNVQCVSELSRSPDPSSPMPPAEELSMWW